MAVFASHHARVYNRNMLCKETIKALPKIELHEHLDGGLRPETVIGIAEERGIAIPSHDPEALRAWFLEGKKGKSLPLYLRSFDVTVSVMQDEESLRRVAREEIEDLAAQNIIYAEIRFAPIRHTAKGLSMHQVVDAVLAGISEGKRETGMEAGLILSAMRTEGSAESLECARLVDEYRDRGAVGFDLAGAEYGYPPSLHAEACRFIREHNLRMTIHSGEAAGMESIWEALQVCGAHRIGHGTRIAEDITEENGVITGMGSLARYILDAGVPLEMCLSSNIDTGAAESLERHPFPTLLRSGFRVSLSSDDRLMSGTDLTSEMYLAAGCYGLGLDDLERITLNAAEGAFVHHEERMALIGRIREGYARIRGPRPAMA